MNGIFRGKVLDNDDPSMFGRVKVEIYPMMLSVGTAESIVGQDLGNKEVTLKGIKTDLMPWAVPAFPLFEGSGAGTGGFTVPKVGTYVFVFFENNDLYQPVYFAEAPNGTYGLPTEREEGYPDRKVWKTSSGFVIYLHEVENEEKLSVLHPSGTSFTIEPDGTVIIDSAKNINLSAVDIDMSASGSVTISGNTVEIN